MQHSSFFKSHHPTIAIKMLLLSEFWRGFGSALFGWILSFLFPVTPFLVIVLALVFCDLYTGTRAAKTRKETIHSRGLRRTVEKLVLYFICILLSEGFRVVFMPAVPVTYLGALAIAITELKSNIENIETVTQVKIWKHIAERIKQFKG